MPGLISWFLGVSQSISNTHPPSSPQHSPNPTPQGLSLFGYDVLVEEGSGKAYIVDINYMPGYAGFDEFHEVLCDMLATSAHRAGLE